MNEFSQPDVTTATIKSASYGGATLSIWSALTLSDVGIIIGIITALLTFALNVWWVRQKMKRSAVREMREIEEHNARMAALGVPTEGLYRRKQGGRATLRFAIGVLSLSAAGLVGILAREDIKTEAYPDPVHGWAVPTIGAGSIVGVKKGDKITPINAVKRAAAESKEKESAIKKCLPHAVLAQHEYDAFVRLAHNIGERKFCQSTAAKKARAGDYAGACDAILLFDRSGKVKQPSDRCSHPENRSCRGLWRDRLETRLICLGRSA